MPDVCGCPPEAGNAVCELPAKNARRTTREVSACPACGTAGKPVQGQTVKALLAVTLRTVRDVDYLFCRTQTCPVVYFSPDGEQSFSDSQIRERVFQKQPESDDVYVCYCFRHTVGDIRTAAPAQRAALIDDINTGIQAGQCACDLRNPQGSCCLGNVRGLVKQLAQATAVAASS